MPQAWILRTEVLKKQIAKEEENLSYTQYRRSGKGSGELHPPDEEPTEGQPWWRTGLDIAFYPFEAVGKVQFGTQLEIEEFRKEQEGKSIWETIGAGFQRREPVVTREEIARQYAQLPIWKQLAYEAPLWAATIGFPTATGLRTLLATKAGIAPKVVRVALAPIAGVEKATAVGLHYGIGVPLKLGGRAVAIPVRRAFETALDRGLAQWLARQGHSGIYANRIVEYFLKKNNAWLIRQADANIAKRLAEHATMRHPTTAMAQQAAADTIKQAEPLLLQAAKSVAAAPTPMTNKLPYLNPQLTPYQAKKQIVPVINELTQHLGVAPLKPIPIITQETMKLNLWNKLGERYKGFINRTYRVENLLLRADKYVDGGKMHQTFWQPIEQAMNRQISQTYYKTDAFRKLLKDNNINLGRMLNQTIETEGIRLTPMERVGIYLHSRNSDNLVHIVFGNNIPAGTVTKIVDSLTPQEMMLARWFQSFYTKQTPLVAHTTKQVTGRTLKTVENYFPLQTQGKAMEMLDFNQFVIDERKLRFASKWASSRIRKGFTLPRTGKAMQPVELDALRIWMKNLEGVEHFRAFGTVIRDLQRVMASGQFRHSLIRSQGKAVFEVMEQWLKDVAKTNPMAVSSYGEKMMRTFRVNAVTAVLGINLTTAMKQFPSYFSGMAEVGVTPVLRGLFTYLNNPKETMALLRKYAPQIYKRRFEREIAEAALMRSMAGKITGRLSPREVFMFMTTTMDRLAVNSIWRGAFDNALKKGMTHQEAAELATRAIRRTQPFFGIKDVPELWRSGELMKALTMFTNQLNQYWNYYRFHIIGKKMAGRISNFEVAKKIIEVFLVPALVIGAITRSRPAQDFKEFATDLSIMGLATVPIFGNWMTQGIKGFYGGGLITTELLDEIRQLSYRVSKEDWDKVALSLPQLAGYAVGIPVAQPKRFLQGIWDIATDKTDDWMRLIWSEYTREQAKKEEPVAGRGSGKLRPPK